MCGTRSSSSSSNRKFCLHHCPHHSGFQSKGLLFLSRSPSPLRLVLPCRYSRGALDDLRLTPPLCYLDAVCRNLIVPFHSWLADQQFPPSAREHAPNYSPLGFTGSKRFRCDCTLAGNNLSRRWFSQRARWFHVAPIRSHPSAVARCLSGAFLYRLVCCGPSCSAMHHRHF